MNQGAMHHADDAVAIVAGIEDAHRRQRRRGRIATAAQFLLVSIILAGSVQLSGVTDNAIDGGWGERIASFMNRLLPNLRVDSLFADRATSGSLASWFHDLPRWFGAMRETIAMAFVGTVMGGLIAFALAFLAARNLNRHRLLRMIVRRGFDAARTIPDAILALIFAAAFSIGAVAGVLTLIVVTTGSLGKLFSEALENAQMTEVEAVRATGGGWLHEMRFGIVPQLLPQLLSYWLLRMEINLSVAAALGIVGAGGIGVELQRAISFTEFDTYLAILLLIVVCIFVIDAISEQLRHRLIGRMAH
jgi:phosphonate transport system permease protein